MNSGLPFFSVDISVDYANKPGVLRNLAFEIRENEILGLVGHSGSGKSTAALSILRLLHLKGGAIEGRISLRGRDLMQLTESKMSYVRGREIGPVS